MERTGKTHRPSVVGMNGLRYEEEVQATAALRDNKLSRIANAHEKDEVDLCAEFVDIPPFPSLKPGLDSKETQLYGLR